MTRFKAERYLILSVRFSRDEANALLDEAEREGTAEHERATVTCKDGTYEVHRPGFSHGIGGYNYLDDSHPVDCEKCGCKHFRHNGRSDVLVGDPPRTCQCGHPAMRHRYREVRQTLDTCKAPETWYPESERILNALAGPS